MDYNGFLNTVVEDLKAGGAMYLVVLLVGIALSLPFIVIEILGWGTTNLAWALPLLSLIVATISFVARIIIRHDAF